MKNSQPICIGITGGIGSGKSFVCKLLEQSGIPVFYTDDEAKLEMRDNADIHRELVSLIGSHSISPDGKPVKAVLSEFICRSNENAEFVNRIVHPRVRQRTLRWKQSFLPRVGAALEPPIVAIECAILFESGFQDLCDKTITVAAPLQTRIDRVCRRDNISPQKALEWINLQMPQEEKIRRSDFCINNDGATPLQPQLREILAQLQRKCCT